MRLFFDDLRVGQRFASGTHPIRQEDISAFATLFDPQPFHLDPAAAEAGPLGGFAASGWHTAAVTMRLLVQSIPLAGGLVGAGGEVTWPRPTRAGDVLQVESEITALRASRSKPDRGIVTARSETRNQRGETVQILCSNLVVPRRPSKPSTG